MTIKQRRFVLLFYVFIFLLILQENIYRHIASLSYVGVSVISVSRVFDMVTVRVSPLK